jgi:hypothetical protein
MTDDCFVAELPSEKREGALRPHAGAPWTASACVALMDDDSDPR